MKTYTAEELSAIRKLALESGFEALTIKTGDYDEREIIVRSLFGVDYIEVLAMNSECVWLDRFVYDIDQSVRAESDLSDRAEDEREPLAAVLAAIKLDEVTV